MAKDVFHEHVIEALKKDGWTVTHDPYILRVEEIEYEVDLGAEKLIAATKNEKKFFQKPFIQKLTKHYNVQLLVFNPKLKKIEKWIKSEGMKKS